MGGEALMFNTSGQGNTATGRSALHNNTTGSFNTASGSFALTNHTVGDSNTAVGASTLFDNQSGIANTAVGRTALAGLLMGDNNTAVGDSAGINNTSGNNNVYIGQGMVGINGENNACYIKSIFGQTAPDSVPVYITSNNKLGTVVSSKRFKEDIKPMDKASEVILSLKPVAFRYKKEIDRTGTSQFGLLAEEVEKVNPNLVVRDKDAKPYSVRYDQVNAMLLNEFLKEHQTVQELKKQVAELTAGLQKVSAHLAAASPSNGGLDLTEPGPAVAINNR
jgi:trimeric autotransporter adhesin